MVENHAFVRDRDVKLLGQYFGPFVLCVHAIVGHEQVRYAAIVHLFKRFFSIWQQIPAPDQNTVNVEYEAKLGQTFRRHAAAILCSRLVYEVVTLSQTQSAKMRTAGNAPISGST